MTAHEITCINKPHHLSPHEQITHIGNAAAGWRLTLESAMDRINNGIDSFYTVDKRTGAHVPIGVVSTSPTRRAYLRTYADGKWNDNLLAQQECGALCRIIS